MNKQTKWFIAGSKALQKERELCRVIFGKMQNKWNSTFIVKTFEDFPTYITNDNLGRQGDYNSYIKNEADGIIFIFDNYVGGITIDEFLLAYNTFIAKGSPKIYIYCRKTNNIENKDIDKLKDLLTSLHQYYIEYTDIEDLKVLISNDIDNYIIENNIKKSEPQIKEVRSEVKVSGSLIAIIIFLISFIVSCCISAKTLSRSSEIPFFILLLSTCGFFLIMILYQKSIFDYLFSKYALKTKFQMLFPYIITYATFASVMIPSYSHYFFYENNIIDIIKSDIKTTSLYLQQITPETNNTILQLNNLDKELTNIKYANNNIDNNLTVFISKTDSLLLKSYHTIKTHRYNINFSNEIDEFIYTQNKLQTANQRIKNVFKIAKEYNLEYYKKYNISFYIFISCIISLIPCICLFILQQYYPNKIRNLTL